MHKEFFRQMPVASRAAWLSVALVAGYVNAGDAKIQPGQWRTTDTIVEMENPLLSEDIVARRKAKPLVVEYCVRSDDLLELVVGKDQGGLCEGAISTDGGKIFGTRKCGGGKTVRKIAGTYTATRFDTVRDVTMETQKGTAHTRSHVLSERIGDCR